jgi:Zn-dependent peptidase ImmA (M78 family)
MSEVASAFDVAERFWAKGPPVDIVGIIRALGISYVEELRPESLSGFIEYDRDNDRYRIVVNSAHSQARRRFTAAHELGHYVYHRDLIGDGIYDDAAYRASDFSGIYSNPKIRTEHETQANRFASVVLMPSELIDRLLIERNLDYGKPDDLKVLARLLEVSEQALRIRLKLD